MSQGASDVQPGAVATVPDAASPATTPAPQPAPAQRPLAVDLTIIALIVAALLGACVVGGIALYRAMYSPSAFVERYVGMLAAGRAADALLVPGVAIDSAQLESAGLPTSASDALLRRDALAPLTDVTVVSETGDGDVIEVVVSYSAAGHSASTTFAVERNGWIGFVPTWRFAKSPLTVIDLTVRGSMRFEVNGFDVDKRQVSKDGAEAAALDAVPLLVFSPGLYAVSVDTAISATPGVQVLADAPLADVPIDIQAEPTEEFIGVVQARVEEFLSTCATQQVLQPTGCPFGYYVQNRIDEPPVWTITTQPTVKVTPNGADWVIPPAEAVAHIEVDIRSLFDGRVSHVSEDVPFLVDGTIVVLPDGTASISIGGPTEP
ncbi:MAG TPA: hypothetical protein VNT50_12995 [Microbacterium sp.]|uniref:hypothetical protein n=1 Tax=Microbacterium sp. TaxID=51671 RepID=UPI002B5572E8|nr:hypothetical protein [Microbacterium sp.]HWI32394.1 hypothetical protein [Microbacterium sp.]